MYTEIGKLVPSLRQEEKEKNEKKAAPVSKKAAKKGDGSALLQKKIKLMKYVKE